MSKNRAIPHVIVAYILFCQDLSLDFQMLIPCQSYCFDTLYYPTLKYLRARQKKAYDKDKKDLREKKNIVKDNTTARMRQAYNQTKYSMHTIAMCERVI